MRTKGPALVLALVLLTGCTTPWFTMPPGSKAYRAGFSEGCDAGYSVAGSLVYPYRDSVEPPPKGDPERIGWLAGFDRCKRNYQRIQRTFSSIFGPP